MLTLAVSVFLGLLGLAGLLIVAILAGVEHGRD